MSDQVDILLVDDRLENRVAISAILDDLKENVVCAASGREALRQVLQRKFAVILMDINMPGMDGFETAHLIRQHRMSMHTPIIFMTALHDDLRAETSYSLGAVDYLLTPVVPTALKTKVSVFVELFKNTLEAQREAKAREIRANQLHKLASASLSINAALSLDAVVQAITDAARDIVQTHGAITRTTSLRPGEPPRTAISVATSSGSLRTVTYEEWVNTTDSTSETHTRHKLSAPLASINGISMGYIELADKIEGEFTRDDEAILVQLAQLGSIAIQNCVNAEAREANRLKDEFLATLSHELRTPLNAILGWANVLRMGKIDESKLAQGLDVIERNVHVQARMIEDLLDISRITTGKLRIATIPLEFASIVEEVTNALRPTAEAKGIKMTVEIGKEIGQVNADSERIQQAISNIISNAIKFTPSGGRIDLSVQRTGAHVELRVTDTGDGIAADFLPFVFERFRQADSSIKRTQGGLGLGLAVARHIVDLHHGSIRADSRGRDQGATFTLRLPALGQSEPEVPMDVRPPTFTKHRVLEGIHVLLVDDNQDARELMEEVLRLQGAQVTAVASAQDAIQAFTLMRPNVLVSDIAMPGQDGYELIRQIRQRGSAAGGDVPAMALTAYARAEDRERALAAGFQTHAAKPIEPAHLVTTVASLVSPGD